MLKIRLRRMGNRNRPFYRVVVSDSRKVPTGAALEEIGHYEPTKSTDSFRLDTARAEHWMAKGAQLSSTVKRLLRQSRESAA